MTLRWSWLSVFLSSCLQPTINSGAIRRADAAMIFELLTRHLLWGGRQNGRRGRGGAGFICSARGRGDERLDNQQPISGCAQLTETKLNLANIDWLRFFLQSTGSNRIWPSQCLLKFVTSLHPSSELWKVELLRSTMWDKNVYFRLPNFVCTSIILVKRIVRALPNFTKQRISIFG